MAKWLDTTSNSARLNCEYASRVSADKAHTEKQRERVERMLGRMELLPEAEKQRKAERMLMARKRGAKTVVLKEGAAPMVITGIEYYKSDARVIYTPCAMTDTKGGRRGLIEELSPTALERLRWIVANSATQALGMLTLTVPSGDDAGDVCGDGAKFKRWLNNFFTAIRKAFGKALAYIWFLEFQASGAPHVHVLTAGIIHQELDRITRHIYHCGGRCGVTKEKPAGNGSQKGERNKCRVVFTGAPESMVVSEWLKAIGAHDNEAAVKFNRGGIWEPIHHPHGAAHYVAKYAYKCEQKTVPENYQNVGRFWARSRNYETPACEEFFTGDEDAVREKLSVEKTGILYPKLFGEGAKQRDKRKEKQEIL